MPGNYSLSINESINLKQANIPYFKNTLSKFQINLEVGKYEIVESNGKSWVAQKCELDGKKIKVLVTDDERAVETIKAYNYFLLQYYLEERPRTNKR